MKKTTVLVGIALILGFISVACQVSIEPPEPQRLAAPANLRINGDWVLEWAAVAGAGGYRVYMGGNRIGSTAAHEQALIWRTPIRRLLLALIR